MIKSLIVAAFSFFLITAQPLPSMEVSSIGTNYATQSQA